MSEPVSERIIKPSDCIVAFGIPTTQEEYLDAVDDPESRDFLTNPMNRPWGKYHRDFVCHLESIAPHLEAMGTRIKYGTRLGDLKEFCYDDAIRVIVLFSHRNGGTIEFFDGMATASDILALIPMDFSGMIDLCVCNPEELYLRLKHERVDCVVKRIEVDATPGLWLYFYHALFKVLREADTTYTHALETVVNEFRRQRQHGKAE